MSQSSLVAAPMWVMPVGVLGYAWLHRWRD
jgi:hypothetical protein